MFDDLNVFELLFSLYSVVRNDIFVCELCILACGGAMRTVYELCVLGLCELYILVCGEAI